MFYASLAAAQPAEFSVLSYNVFLRAPTWIFHNQHDWRSERIPLHLLGYDAVVLQEAFSNDHREEIIAALANEYPYHSDILGDDEFLSYNGGVIILSRWPITTQAQMVFDNCAGSDCMVKKGVVYAAINKAGLNVHLFGLHLQAEQKYSAARIAQFPQIHQFIDRQQIESSEPILVAGDFNVDYFANDNDGEFNQLLDAVSLQQPNDALVPSYDGASNSLIKDSVSERLDYIFFSSRHRKPLKASNEVLFFRDGNKDLSDHHPVLGRFTFGNQQ